MRTVAFGSAWALLVIVALGTSAWAADAADPPAAEKKTEKKYDLKYKFRPGETVRWKVEHRAKIRTTISGTTQTAETESYSVKVWKVQKVSESGNFAFEHSVESILMKQRLSGRQEEVYDSTKDKEPPVAFQQVAKSVGVPLSLVAMDPTGKILKREDRQPQASSDSQMTVPLPAEPVAVGHTWNVPLEVEVKLENGVVKKIQTRQQFKLEEVKNGVATISTETVVLTPVRDPAIEAQLIQRASSGTVRFDIEAGRVLGQQMDLDKQVFGFRGEASTMQYQTRFIEKLLTDDTAARVKPAGPELPTKK